MAAGRRRRHHEITRGSRARRRAKCDARPRARSGAQRTSAGQQRRTSCAIVANQRPAPEQHFSRDSARSSHVRRPRRATSARPACAAAFIGRTICAATAPPAHNLERVPAGHGRPPCAASAHACTRRHDEIYADGFSSSKLAGTNSGEAAAAAVACTGRRRRGL
ncbi:hypothetical protein F511_45493 [Dorcoceras hygrometricum]|uniref:Uncharacterized protein n=1 Tax=Dorcoceras hygrometricum TaxID=472368 RepID=A0A2Z6ZVV7_9LAMI|nr:hypothetical protein F511_45493 [Dorcoceras hygrometricum]